MPLAAAGFEPTTFQPLSSSQLSTFPYGCFSLHPGSPDPLHQQVLLRTAALQRSPTSGPEMHPGFSRVLTFIEQVCAFLGPPLTLCICKGGRSSNNASIQEISSSTSTSCSKIEYSSNISGLSSMHGTQNSSKLESFILQQPTPGHKKCPTLSR